MEVGIDQNVVADVALAAKDTVGAKLDPLGASDNAVRVGGLRRNNASNVGAVAVALISWVAVWGRTILAIVSITNEIATVRDQTTLAKAASQRGVTPINLQPWSAYLVATSPRQQHLRQCRQCQF